MRPPIAPPTTAPRLIEEDVIEEYTVELELDAGEEVVSTTVAVDRKAGLLTELLITELELDGVAVVSAVVGTGRSLSV